MSKALKNYPRLLLLVCLLLSGVVICHAQEPDTGYAVSDTASSSFEEENEVSKIDGEYDEPKRPVVYNTSSPNAVQWREATSGSAYSYRDKREFLAKDAPEEDETWIIKALVSIYGFLSSPLGKILLWTAFILIVAFVVYKIVRGQGGWIFGAKDRKPEESDPGEVSEQSLLERDWEALMRDALQAGNSRDAVRYSYLCLLQLLQERGYIAYRPDKTNTDYYRELADKPQRPAFRAVTRQYEWTWYGNFLPEKPVMDGYLQTFQQLKSSLGSA